MRGGARPGAGRKKGARKSNGYLAPDPSSATGKKYSTAEAYLAAVVSGDEPPDRDRIAAAKAMMPYQTAKVRAPVKTPAPKTMQKNQEQEQAEIQREAWQRKKEEVRRRLGKVK